MQLLGANTDASGTCLPARSEAETAQLQHRVVSCANQYRPLCDPQTCSLTEQEERAVEDARASVQQSLGSLAKAVQKRGQVQIEVRPSGKLSENMRSHLGA